jgi:2-isopropylmalate synthase
MPNKVNIYDTTLRDGTQGEDVNLSASEKIKIALELDRLGFDYIEGGWPGSNAKDKEFFEKCKNIKFKNSKIAAFSMTRRKDIKCEDDQNMITLLKADTPVVTIVGKSWDMHANIVLKVTLEENIEMIKDTIKFFKKNDREVIFDAEHYFDGFKANKDYAIKTLKTAQDAGADCIVLCDTNGGTMPDEICEIIKETKKHISKKLGIHCHNDSGLAIANSIEAVNNGITHIQGTINGLGERTGNADILSIIANLQLKKNILCLPKESIPELKKLSLFVYETMNIIPSKKQPFFGESAFAHKGGMHADAVSKDPKTYEHIIPESVGNIRRILASDLSGKSNILMKSKEFKIRLDEDQIKAITQIVKNNENKGYHYEAADASLALLMMKQKKDYEALFITENFKVITERDNGMDKNKADITLKLKNQIITTESIGNGPVDALNRALRKALVKFYPKIEKIHLTDFKVRIIDGEKATAATTRVLIESSDNNRSWTTIGVSNDIITASYEALVDGIEFGILTDLDSL